jgi:alpha-ketoglutarate-dependent taurine dioxygenase
MNDIALKTVSRISDIGGIEITDLDLSKPLDDETQDAVRKAFLEHSILVFRNQKLTPVQQEAFTRQFGELEDHVIRRHDGSKMPLVQQVANLDADGNPTYKPLTHGNYFWHTDKSYHAHPSLATLLHAVELPAAGGDTQFANMYMAYDALSDEQKEEYAALKVVHSWEANRRNTGNKPASEQEKRERPPVTHPLIRTHPETGRKTLYLGTHTSHIEGREAEGRQFLEDLQAFATQGRFVYSHKWRLGDLVMWDNRCLLHRAIANYGMSKERRVLHRTVIKGTDVPH